MADVKLAAAIKLARERGDARHSPAYHYVRKNFRAFVRAGYGVGPGLGSEALREILNAAGQLNSKGQPFTAPVAMALFKRVRADVASQRAAREANRAHLRRPPSFEDSPAAGGVPLPDTKAEDG